jgi:hypothetical protein
MPPARPIPRLPQTLDRGRWEGPGEHGHGARCEPSPEHGWSLKRVEGVEQSLVKLWAKWRWEWRGGYDERGRRSSAPASPCGSSPRRERERRTESERERVEASGVAWPSGHHPATVVGPPSAYGRHLEPAAWRCQPRPGRGELVQTNSKLDDTDWNSLLSPSISPNLAWFSESCN